MICSNCGEALEEGVKFCPYCGQKTEKHCLACGKVIEESAKFCSFCGKLVDEDKIVMEETNKQEYPGDKFVIKKDTTEKDSIKEKNNSDGEISPIMQLIVIVIMVVILFTQFDSIKYWVGRIIKPRPVPTLKDNIPSSSGKIEDESEKFIDVGYAEYIQVGNLDVFLP